MQLSVNFVRAHYRVVFCEERLPKEGSRLVAQFWKHRKAQDAELQKTFARLEEAARWRRSKHVPERFAGLSGPALWVVTELGDPPHDLPDLSEVAQCRGLDHWRSLIWTYGLPDLLKEDVVVDLPKYYLVRVPLWWLECIAREANALKLCEAAAVQGDVESLRREIKGLQDQDMPLELEWPFDVGEPEGEGDLQLVEFARDVIATALKEALERMEPHASGGRGPGISDDWALYAGGWWPLVILQEFVHKSRYARLVKCASSDCSRIVPPSRRRWCSQRCKEREKKRRQRSLL